MAKRRSVRQRICALRHRAAQPAPARRTAVGHHGARPPRRHPIRLHGRGRAGWLLASRGGPTLVLQGGDAGPTRLVGEPPSVRIRLDVILPVLLFALSLFQNMSDVDDTVFHPDESRWLNRAHFLVDLRDPFGPTWQEQYLTRAQPPLGSYFMGLGLLLQGRDTETTAVWDFAYGVEWNEQAGAMPVGADLNAGRRANAVLGAIAVVVVYFIGRELTSRVGAALGAAFLALHPLHIWLASQALSDQLLNLLVALATLAAIRYARQPTWPRAVTLGVLLGLGGATKLSPMLLSIPLAGFGLFLILRSFTRFRGDTGSADRSMGAKLLTLPPVAFAVFVLSYPYLWPRPIQRTINLFELRAQEMAGQARAWPDVAVENRLDAMARIGERLTEQFSTSGRLVALGAQVVGVDWQPHGRDFIPVLIGAVLFVALVIRRGVRSPAGFAALLLVSQAGAIVVGLRADFYRYHLPIVLIMSVCFALTAGATWGLLSRAGAWRWLALLPGVAVSPVRSRRHGTRVSAAPDAERASSEPDRAGLPAPATSPLRTVPHGK